MDEVTNEGIRGYVRMSRSAAVNERYNKKI
jgi:hypothetical protein